MLYLRILSKHQSAKRGLLPETDLLLKKRNFTKAISDNDFVINFSYSHVLTSIA